jgi:hypothetical protein
VDGMQKRLNGIGRPQQRSMRTITIIVFGVL